MEILSNEWHKLLKNIAFVSTLRTNNNDDVSTVFGVSTGSPQVSTANLSDATMYAFLANQPNGSQLVHEDLEQIHEDDLDEMDLNWLGANTIKGKGWGEDKGDKITGKGIIKTGKLDFKDVYFVKELKFDLFSVSQMYDKKNSVLFTDTEYFVLSFDLKLADESHVLLKVPRKNNMYNVDIKNSVPKRI
uniref:Ribonuclease H-like domain-containing protein n=1 Tax=Tanacetum cinerariifolium TaxID=118510 RepID=A0A6L2JJY9_TANCI|nr:ribonuclease H-like domain-containing protein [Tanacetum cinerariifolium]